MATSLQNNMVFQFAGTLTTAGDTVDISVDLERSQVVTFTNAYIEIKNRRWTIIERCRGTAALWTLTLSLRWLDQSDANVEVASLKKEWKEWVIAYITILSVQLVDRQASNVFEWTQTFANIDFNDTTVPWLNVQELTTVEITALPLTTSWIVKDSDTWEYKWQSGWTVYTFSMGSTQPNASTTVAGKVEAPTQTQVEQLATTWETWALVFVTPTTINPSSITSATILAGDKISFADVSDSNYLKSTTIQGILNLITSMYRGDWSDWDVVLSWAGTTTLTRDMQYNNLTITSPAILDPAWYRIFVRGTLSWTGTISRNGNAGSAWGVSSASPTSAWWAAWTTLWQGSLNAEIWAWAGGNGASPWVAWTAWTASTLSLSNVSSVQWWAWWTWWSWAWAAAWALAASTRGSKYNTVVNSLSILFHSATAQWTQFENYKGKASSSGGWWGTGNGDAGWAWGWAWGNGWLIWIASYIFSFTWIVTATGWAGWVGWAWSLNRWGWGGGWWGNWGTFLRMYNTIPNDCTKTLTGWAWWAWWAIWSGSSTAGSAWTTGATGETISITI